MTITADLEPATADGYGECMAPTERAVEQIPVTLKVSRAQVQAYEAAAAAACGMSRQAWCKAILDAAAGVSAIPGHIKAGTRAAKRLKKSS